MHGLILILLSIIPYDGVARDRVDLIEKNSFYDEKGRMVFEQIIFYDWSADLARYMVRAWRLIKHPSQLPRWDWCNESWVAIWFDGDLLREVAAKEFRESWTQYDPELKERDWLPKERRKELLVSKPNVRKR